MPYKDAEKNREYQRQWSRDRFQNEEERERRRVLRSKWRDENKAAISAYMKALRNNPLQKDKARIASKDRRDKIRDWFIDLKSTLKCSHCSENHPAVLDFHHEDPSMKEFNISSMIKRRNSIETIESEIEKCIVLCANCHRKLHWEEDAGLV